MKTNAFRVNPKDNVVVEVDAVVYYEVTDPIKVTYNVANFYTAATKLAQTNLRNLVGDISGRFRYSDVVNSDEADGINDEFRSQAGAGLSYLPLRWMTLALNYTYTKYAADGDENYDENRVMFTVTLQPDQPWKF